MTYPAYFRFGDTEIINNTRTVGLVRTARCASSYLKGEPDDSLRQWLGHDPYVYGGGRQDAPWDGLPIARAARDFLGVYGVTVDGIDESTYTADVTQVAGKGGIVGAGREATRRVRFRVILSALNAAGMEYGLGWLTRVLRGRSCGVHAGSCGRGSLHWLQDKPLDGIETGGVMGPEARYLHNVKLVVPPTVEKKVFGPRLEGWTDSEGIYDPNAITMAHHYTVSFAVEAENPSVYSGMFNNEGLVFERGFIEDAPINLMTHPSAEKLIAGRAIIARNYMTNPSIEANLAQTSGTIAAVSGASPAGLFSYAQAADVSAYGSRSACGTFAGISTGTRLRGRARMTIYQEADMSTAPDAPVSMTLWSKLAQRIGSGMGIISFRTYGQWYTAGGAAVGSPLTIISLTGSTARSRLDAGVMAQQASFARPATGVKLRVATELVFDWSSGTGVSTPTRIRFAADAFGAMIP